MIGKVGERSDFILENEPWRLEMKSRQILCATPSSKANTSYQTGRHILLDCECSHVFRIGPPL